MNIFFTDRRTDTKEFVLHLAVYAELQICFEANILSQLLHYLYISEEDAHNELAHEAEPVS